MHEDRKIYIKLNADLEIPTGSGGESDFVPEVDDWGEVNEDIIL